MIAPLISSCPICSPKAVQGSAGSRWAAKRRPGYRTDETQFTGTGSSDDDYLYMESGLGLKAPTGDIRCGYQYLTQGY